MSEHGGEATSLGVTLRDAYEAMGPSPEAEARVLAALREEVARDPYEARVTPRRPAWLLVALPLAACVALVAVVLSVRAPREGASSQDAPTAQPMAYEMDAADEQAKDVAGSMGDLASASDDAVEAEDAAMNVEESSAVSMAAQYPVVELPSGRELRVGEPHEGEVDATDAVAASAKSADGSRSTSCEVVNERWVRFEDDTTWYALVE